jgi:asparagine synthase (glutamine-hydrolysing)
MCGIVGIFSHQTRNPDQTRSDLYRMASYIQHRGPDGAGFMLAAGGQVGLAQTRLSIVDLAGGQQPLVNEDGQLVLVANGEIYDYERWRRQLEEKGHRFATRSDSELILHLYEEFGIDCIKELNGEFAFILWDGHRQELLAGRDVFGIKPLFYAEHGACLYLASEIKALHAAGLPRAINPEYFVGTLMGSLSVGPSPFAGIRSLLPGHILRARMGQSIQQQPYYQPSFQTDPTLSFPDAMRRCRELLESAVQRRLVADVPVHVYLSGGLDSTSIAALMKRLGHHPTAFSVSFPGSEMDESSAVASTAKALSLDLDILRCDMDQLAEHLIATIWATEAPIGNLNSVAKFLLARHVHGRGVKVCLTGEGSDELFCGYANWKLEAILRLQQGSTADRQKARELWQILLSREGRNEGVMWNRSVARQARKAQAYYGFPSFYRSNVERMDGFVQKMISPHLRSLDPRLPTELMALAHPKERYQGWDPLNTTRSLALAALASYIIPNLGDRVEMANSLECRTPFMDVELLRFLETVPTNYLLKQDSLREKHLLYESLRDVLPAHIYQGHKHPFLSPSWRQFARTACGKDLIATFLNPREIEAAGLFNSRAIQVIQSLWQTLPDRSPLRKSLDVGIGAVISSQIMHRLFILEAPQVRPLESFVERVGQHWRELPAVAQGGSRPPAASLPSRLPPTTLSEWESFVLRHQKFGNLAFHLVSALFFCISPLLALLTGQILWLGFFMISGLVGTAGHYLFRDGGVSVREATFQWSVPYYVLKMFWQLLSGCYAASTREALARQQQLKDWNAQCKRGEVHA